MSAHRRLCAIAVALPCALALWVAYPQMAPAALRYPYSGISFGPSGPGTFGNVQGVAVDQASGYVYVYDNTTKSIYKFDSSGSPIAFSELGANVIEGAGGTGSSDENELAVDSSAAGPAKGDIYLANGTGVKVYGPGGSQLGELNKKVAEEKRTPKAPWSEPCGVATDPAGHVYVGLSRGFVNRYAPTANPVTNASYTSSLRGLNHFTSGEEEEGEVCNIAVDSSENVYVDTWNKGPVREYPASQFGLPEATGTLIAARGSTLAVNPANDNVYINQRNQIAQYGPGHEPLGTTGATGLGALGGESLGIGVNGPEGKLYASSEGGVSVNIFTGPPVVIPDVVTGAASKVHKTDGIISGTVNADGEGKATYYFQYSTNPEFPPAETITTSEEEVEGNEVVHVSATLTSLEPNTTYNYRLVAKNANGENFGEGKTFTTVGTVNVFNPCVVSNVQGTSATFTAITDPESAIVSARYYFQYGLNSESLTSTPVVERLGETEEELTSSVEGLIPRSTYICRLVGENEFGTSIGSETTFTTPIPRPTVNDQPPFTTGVSLHEATLNAVINPGNDAASYHFIYGSTSEYGSSTPTAYTQENHQDDAVEQLIAGLQSGVIYHYALVATNSSGTTTGPDETFATLAGAPPAVETGGASGVTTASATISGVIDTGGATASYSFEVGTSTAYGTRIFGTVSAREEVTASLAGLLPGTVYHYRLLASGAGGAAFGGDRTFSTAEPIITIFQPIAPPLLLTPAFPPPEPTKPPPPLKCKRGFVKKRGKCVKKHHAPRSVRRTAKHKK